MADLPDLETALTIKIVGSSLSGTETNAVNADANGNLQVVPPSNGPVVPGTVAIGSNLIGGQFNAALPILTTAQQSAVQLDSSGRILIAPLTVSSVVTAAEDHNYGVVGANTLRTAAQIGNATGAADFNAGATGAQTLRTAANLYDSSGVGISSTLISGKQRLDINLAAGGPVTPGAVAVQSVLIGGQFNTTLPTLTNTQQSAIQVDSNGRILVTAIVKPSTGTLTDRSGSATNVSTQIMAANSNRKYLFIQNLSPISIWINFTTVAITDQPSIQLEPNATFTMENNFISTEAINVITGSGSRSYVAKEA